MHSTSGLPPQFIPFPTRPPAQLRHIPYCWLRAHHLIHPLNSTFPIRPFAAGACLSARTRRVAITQPTRHFGGQLPAITQRLAATATPSTVILQHHSFQPHTIAHIRSSPRPNLTFFSSQTANMPKAAAAPKRGARVEKKRAKKGKPLQFHTSS